MPDGLAKAELARSDGRIVTLWVDERFDHLMIYTGDTLEPERRRRGVAIEPMTCPPNALSTGRGVIRLEPGSTWQAAWGIEA